MASNQLRALESFTACDISDALLKLKVPRAGFVADLTSFAPHWPASSRLFEQAKIIAPASTVLLVPKSHSSSSVASSDYPAESNIPANTHYVDITKSGTVVCLSQPKGQYCAVLGGIMAQRMKIREASAVVVGGRIRDLGELRTLDLPIWATGTSTVGTGAEAKPWSIDVPININGVDISPGDIVFADPVEGVVVIPKDKLDEVVDLVPKLTQADDKVAEDVRNGANVRDSFIKYRG